MSRVQQFTSEQSVFIILQKIKKISSRNTITRESKVLHRYICWNWIKWLCFNNTHTWEERRQYRTPPGPRKTRNLEKIKMSLWCSTKPQPTNHFTFHSFQTLKSMKCSITSHRAGTDTTASSTPWRWLIWAEWQMRVKFTFENKKMHKDSCLGLTKLKLSSFWSRLFHSWGSYTWYSKHRSATNRTACKTQRLHHRHAVAYSSSSELRFVVTCGSWLWFFHSPFTKPSLGLLRNDCTV